MTTEFESNNIISAVKSAYKWIVDPKHEPLAAIATIVIFVVIPFVAVFYLIGTGR